MMKRKQRVTAVMALVCVTAVVISSIPLFASDIVTIIGRVNETNQIVVDEDIYEVDDTPEGEDEIDRKDKPVTSSLGGEPAVAQAAGYSAAPR